MKGAPIILAALFLDGLQGGLSLGFVALGPAGVLLGFVTNASLTLSIGGAILLLLAFNGSFYPTYVITGFMGEIAPGINNLPIWTTIVVLCLLRKEKEEGSGMLAVVAGAALTLLPGGAAGKVSSALRAAPVTKAPVPAPRAEGPEQKESRVPLLNYDVRLPGKGAPKQPHAKTA